MKVFWFFFSKKNRFLIGHRAEGLHVFDPGIDTSQGGTPVIVVDAAT